MSLYSWSSSADKVLKDPEEGVYRNKAILDFNLRQFRAVSLK